MKTLDSPIRFTAQYRHRLFGLSNLQSLIIEQSCTQADGRLGSTTVILDLCIDRQRGFLTIGVSRDDPDAMISLS